MDTYGTRVLRQQSYEFNKRSQFISSDETKKNRAINQLVAQSTKTNDAFVTVNGPVANMQKPDTQIQVDSKVSNSKVSRYWYVCAKDLFISM